MFFLINTKRKLIRKSKIKINRFPWQRYQKIVRNRKFYVLQYCRNCNKNNRKRTTYNYSTYTSMGRSVGKELILKYSIKLSQSREEIVN